MKMVWEFLKANFRAFFRDKVSLFFGLAFPVIFMLIFGMIYGSNDSFKATVGLVATEDTPATQAIIKAFHDISVFEVTESSYNEGMAQLKKGEIKALIVLPQGLETNIEAGSQSDIAVYYDPSQTTTSQVVVPVISRTIAAIDQQITMTPSMLQVREQSIQTHKLRSIDYLVPGVISMSILSTGLMSAMPFIQRREKKILKRLGAMPIKRSTIIYSEVIFRVIITLIQTVLIISIAYFIFDVPILGNLMVLTGFVVLGTLAFVSLGYVIGSFVRTEEGAIPVIQLIQFPMMFLSGIFFPVDTLPGFMKPVIAALPLSYLGDAFRQIMVQWTPGYTLAICTAVLAGWTIVCMGISVKYFRWE